MRERKYNNADHNNLCFLASFSELGGKKNFCSPPEVGFDKEVVVYMYCFAAATNFLRYRPTTNT